MNEMERMVWAAAFAAAYNNSLQFGLKHKGGCSEVYDGLRQSGFSFGELADLAVESYREMMAHSPDKGYLLMVKEKWDGTS